MRIAIGILAHNEEGRLGQTIASLFAQSLFLPSEPRLGIERIQVVCIPNGCTDATAEEARRAFEMVSPATPDSPEIETLVHELALGDKANAWNVFVHELAEARSDFLCLIDADILFRNHRTLENMVRLLVERSDAVVAIDRPIKVISEASHGSLISWVFKFDRSVATTGEHSICGQLYLARSKILRAIWLPPGLPGEDGFIRACVVTGGFRHPDRLTLIQRAQDADHTFEWVASVRQLIRHSKRMMIGSTINSYIYSEMWNNMEDFPDVKTLIQFRLGSNRNWVHEIIRGRARERYWLIPGSLVNQKLARLRKYPYWKRVVRFPVICSSWLFDVYIAYLSNRILRRDGGVGFW